MRQFGPTLKLPWTRLAAPELTDSLVEKVAAGAERLAAGRDVRELERLRDECLVAIMRALRTYEVGAGHVLAAHEERPSRRHTALAASHPARAWPCRVAPAGVTCPAAKRRIIGAVR